MKNYLIILILLILFASCNNNAILEKAYYLEELNNSYVKNLYFIDENTLLYGSDYLIELKDMSVKKIQWNQNLFSEFSIVYFYDRRYVVGYTKEKNIVIGDLQTNKCEILSNNIKISYGSGFYVTDKGIAYIVNITNNNYALKMINLVSKSIVIEKKLKGTNSIFGDNLNLFIETEKSNEVNVYSLETLELIETLNNASLSYGRVLEIIDYKSLLYSGGLSFKRFITSNKVMNNIIYHNLKTGEKRDILENYSKNSFNLMAKHDDKIALIFENEEKKYLYLDTMDNLIKDFNTKK